MSQDNQNRNYEVFQSPNGGLIKAWTKGVPFDDKTKQQLKNIADMPFVFRHIAAMSDAHAGKGSCVGAVIPTKGAIIPAAVGADLFCGVDVVQTSLKADNLPDDLHAVRTLIEQTVPHGRTNDGRVELDKGVWRILPKEHELAWLGMKDDYDRIVAKHPKIGSGSSWHGIGTLGSGNHALFVAIDQNQSVWIGVHSGSRGVGARFGNYFSQRAKNEMEKYFIKLPDSDLAYFPEKTEDFNDYMKAIHFAKDFAIANRALMVQSVVKALAESNLVPLFSVEQSIVCNHNFVTIEEHFGEKIFVTRKGAVRARPGEWGVILGNMRDGSAIVQGKGNPDSFASMSHGAGRTMSRTEAKKRISLEQHIADTQGVECRKDAGVIDESPKNYKDFQAVLDAQSDLIDIRYMLKEIVNIKG